MTAISEKTVGTHQIVQEAEDLLTLHFSAAPTESEMRAIVDAEVELAAGRPMFVIIDLRNVETLSSGARRVIGEAAQRVAFKGLAMYGANFQMRVIAKLVNGALALFSRSPFPQEFLDSYEAARAWVEQHRNKNAAGAA